MKLRPLFLSGLLMVCASAAVAASASRERLLMDFGWRFHLGNEWGAAHNLGKAGTGYGPAAVGFSDVSWRRVDLPHDWVVELPFDQNADTAHGFKPVGEKYPQNSVGWYRRTFDLPASDAGRRLWLEFDGAFRDCEVFVNGWHVGHHEGGYMGFRYDITDVANYGGKNVVAVKVDATQFEGWFYEGGGLYRHAWLVKTGPVAIAPDGIFVFSEFPNNVPTGPAEVHVETEIMNAGNDTADLSVTWQIFGPDGQVAASGQQATALDGTDMINLDQTLNIDVPQLWSPETPRLYKLVTTITSGNAEVDRVTTEFGVRTFAFDANKGFLLNGKPYVLKGTCNHQDHAGVGAALPDAVQYYRIARLKEMGANAYRTAHNAPTPELLDACDHLGLLVMDESRLLSSAAANLESWENQIRRDRNHASVAIWSIGNEEFSIETTPAGARSATSMQGLAHRLDPTRPVTYNAPIGNVWEGVNSVMDVRGWSYRIGVDRMDAYHAAHPQQPNVGSEQGSTVSTRGIYANDPVRGYVSAYDDNAPEWANTAEQWMSFFATRPWLSGGFVWTGFDYRGEPTPYAWPCISSHFGILDTCGYPKDNFWYYQSWWTSAPVLHLLPHWNWAGREGQEIDVRALSNCDEVELFLNGRSLGRQVMPRDSELKWKVPYAPGVLSAKGYKAGQVVAETKVETTGAAAAVQLTPDRASINADGEDAVVFKAAILDDQGRVVPTAGSHLAFELEGPGKIIGVGNGDPSCHEPDVYVAAVPIKLRPIGDWRLKKFTERGLEARPELKPEFDDSSWATTDVTVENGPLGNHERAIYRTRVNVTAAELASATIELFFARIDGQCFVWVNGEKIGGGDGAHGETAYDVKSRLHVGDNAIAVTVENWGDSAGLTKGVFLRTTAEPATPQWSRSAFNGLAQVIVKASKQSGTLKLTARAEGLKPATAVVEVKQTELRPELP